MNPRHLTDRERDVLDALLTVEFDGVERLRVEAATAQVCSGCGCGCPSIDFFQGQNNGMRQVVNASVRNSPTYDGLFLFTVTFPYGREVLGGIEWVSQGDVDPDELPLARDQQDLRQTHGSTAYRQERTFALPPT